MDEHGEVERRAGRRRNSDIEDVGEVRLLRHEIGTLRDRMAELRTQMDEEEREDHERLRALEAQVAEFERKFNVGKGIFYGGVAVLGTTGVYMVDHMKELLERIMK